MGHLLTKVRHSLLIYSGDHCIDTLLAILGDRVLAERKTVLTQSLW